MNFLMTPRFEAKSDLLTPKQLAVVIWCVEGKTFDEIAEILGCKRSTVKKHLMLAAMRMECGSQRAEITAHAISNQVVLLRECRGAA